MGPLIPLGVSIGSKLLGGLFGGKAKKKQAEAQNKAAIGQAELKNQMAEDSRLGKANAGMSLLDSLAGKGFTNISPEAAAALKQRRTYDFSKAVPAAGAGMGSELLSGLFGGIGDVASQYGINQGEGAGGGSTDIFKTGAGPTLQGDFQSVMGGGAGSGDLGTGSGVGPNGVSLDDLKNLYKLGGSGTQDFG